MKTSGTQHMNLQGTDWEGQGGPSSHPPGKPWAIGGVGPTSSPLMLACDLGYPLGFSDTQGPCL